MGAWGYGILQNDSAQDGLAEVIQAIEEDITALDGRKPSEKSAARLGAAVGLLLQLSSCYSFDQENEASATILHVLRQQQPQYDALPRKARQLLMDVGDGKGGELSQRPGKYSRALQRALFATPSADFPMERTFGKREPCLFAHPHAVRYVQEVARRCVACIDKDFAEEEIASDLSREAGCMGAFGLLLVLEPCNVPVKKIERWRKTYRRAMAAVEADALEEFDHEYGKCLELAFRLMLRKFSPK